MRFNVFRDLWCRLAWVLISCQGGLGMGAAPFRAKSEPLNVLLLYADDWRHDTLGCAGHPVVKTPHLDRLAREGVRFSRNAVTTSICGVSRATLFTGQWMSRHGNRGFNAWQTPWEETFPARLRAAGYWVGHVGKWHNGRFPAERFDFGRSYAGRHWIQEADGSRIHVTSKNERDALEFLRKRPSDRPFQLTVAFFAAHAEDGHPQQFLPQPESMALYREARVPVPRTMTESHFSRLPSFLGNETNEGRRRWRWRFDTEDRYQEYMKNYYRLVTEVDEACGRLLRELEQQELLNRTLVVFTTDNGYLHGEHGLADKWYPFEESIRVPLIVRDPRLAPGRRGQVREELTLNVDLAPTLLAAAGLPAAPGMQGRDFAPLYLKRLGRPAWRKAFFYEHPTIQNRDFIPASQAWVSREWKYWFWPEFQRDQLFDLRSDPGEERDLAGETSQARRLSLIRKRFGQLREQAGAASQADPQR